MKRKLLFLVLGIVPFLCANAQRNIEPRLIFSDTAAFNFTGEWQYLSTDIFLFNGNKFSTLINELDFGNHKRGLFRRKRSAFEKEQLEYLFITASLKNVKFFGDNDITYPLYNFQISRDKENKYQTFVSDNIDHVRIIDNLPLYNARDYIDAEIRVRAITRNDRDQVLSLVASQLKNIAKIATPTDAIMSIIGEFGNFIEANTKRKEYRFSSTIRLFEQKNFDTRIHSIKLYALTTANSDTIGIDLKPIKAFLDTVSTGKVSRNTLSSLIGYKTYPLIAVVNYQSLYRMEPVSGDEVTFANIEKRKLKVENDFRQGLINAETYRQEKDFIGFLTVFANLKNHLDVYSLNYRTGNTDAIASSLFRVMQYYRQLLKSFEEIRYKYSGNTTFSTIFEEEYESILGFASIYLDNDHNLKSTKALVNTLIALEKQKHIAPTELEAYIETLRFADIFKPELTQKTAEGALINEQVTRLEEQLYRSKFAPAIEQLDTCRAIPANRKLAEQLLKSAQNSACVLCKDNALAAIADFGKRLDRYYRKQELNRYDSLVYALQPWIFRTIDKIRIQKNYFDIMYADKTGEESIAFIIEKLNEAERDLNNIRDFIKISISGKDISTIRNLNEKLLRYKTDVEKALKLIEEVHPRKAGRKLTRKEQIRVDSTIRSNNIFIAIFEYELTTTKPNGPLRTKLDRLKRGVELLSKGSPRSEEIGIIEQKINRLVREIGRALAKSE